ncbi:hypothetical protein NDI54_05940 [Haloarcula sp. S1AR25-5A]|uniref:DNA primase/polymerase bifunctional N-terminal domain-containing protein n=1 Tax=Haloarcula terrestris TaxID=2950533 RepID=A0AAE4JGV8_9EURY|nr:bifunctional DNA primase/polymerase [Haloarcula terrestris]MDS0220895.1 hypothetical protein [Haloarcula terrestris]
MTADIPDAVTEAIAEWTVDHEPVSRAEFDRLNSALIRTVGEAAEHEELGRNQHLRRTDAESAGLFAFEYDVALAELDDDVQYADLHGYAVNDGFVPILVCLAGDIDAVNERQHRLYHLIDDTSPCECRAATDGGRSLRERVERYRERHPDAGVPAIAGALGESPAAVAETLEQAGDADVSDATASPTDDSGPAFDYESLRYIQLRGDGSKLPAKTWGGYDQDFDDAAHVHRHDAVDMHPAENWGIVDVESGGRMSQALLIFDVDIHKSPDGFDPDRVNVPADTLVTRSQNGGFHVYFKLSGYRRGDLQESDFQMTADPGFDVDIRGSVVSHHVVAPADIPGVGGAYDVVNDSQVRPVFEPGAAAERITFDGEPLLEFDPDGGVDSYDFDVPDEPPAEMPTCYHAGLELRKAAPDDHPNSHKVNVLTAACGLAAGYDPEEVAAHFCGDWAPRDGDTDLTDKETTEYQVQHIDDGGYSPPAESTLRDYGILDEGEHCEDCPIEYHGAPTGRDGGPDTVTAGQWAIEECEPPARDAEAFDREQRWADLQGERFDEAVGHAGIDVWADEAGAGKTTNAALGALDRDEAHVIYFDKHEKAREFVTDDAIQAAAGDADIEYFHLKGGAQKREGGCMDADHADANCPEHGDTQNCPPMCPIYELDPDHETRQAYDALVPEVGPNRAHQILGLHDEGQHEWHGQECAWQAQYAAVESERFVVAVHPYVTQKTVRETGLNIIDETPDLHAREQSAGPTELTRAANTLERVADLRSRDDPVAHTARELARFARDVVDVITDVAAADGLADLDAPSVTWNAYESYDDVAGGHVARDSPEEGWQLAEALARAKIAHGETVLTRMQNDEWGGTPISIDPLLAAAVEAGLDEQPVMQAVALSPVVDSCPWCGSEVGHHDGARCCASEDCDWDEREHGFIAQNADTGRATAWLADPAGETASLRYRELPLPSDLPAPTDTLVLDATATPDKVATLFGVDRDAVAVTGDEPLAIPNLHTTQVLDGQYHANTIRRALEEDRTLATRIQRSIDTAAEVHDAPLYVVKAGLIPEFDFPDHGEVLHYHATRGLNRNDCDAVLCIGAPHPNVDDLRRNAGLLTMGREDLAAGGAEHSTRQDASNPPVYRKLDYEDDGGRGRAVPTKHYTGLVGTLFRETREKELVQALHRIRPLLADDTKHAYLLTNVPTATPVDALATFEELADPLEAMLPVPDGAITLLETVHDVVAGEGPDGFRAGQLVETRGDGVANKVSGYHRLAQMAGLEVSERTVYNWVSALEGVGLLQPESYEQRAGVSYAVDTATLKSALSVLSNNGGFKVAAVRRFRRILEESDSGLGWLDRAREVFTLQGIGPDRDPPPTGG